MPAQSVFRWREGRGWLIFSGGEGGAYGNADVRAMALGRMAADGGAACVAISRDNAMADHLLDDLEDLGAPSGYVVDLASETDDAIQTKLAEAGLIALISDEAPAVVASNLLGAALEGIETAYQNGAILLFEGSCASAFGAFILDGETLGESAGFAWLENSVILTHVEDVTRAAAATLLAHDDALAVGMGAESALALGPDGEIELWGRRRVGVTLGAQYRGA